MFLKAAYRIVSGFGLDPFRVVRNLSDFPRFLRGWAAYARLRPTQFPIKLGSLYPALGEAVDSSDVASGHYFHQDLWAAREIYRRKPARHVDVGSRVDGFIAHLLSFREVEYVDIRPLANPVVGLQCIQDDATTMGRFANDSLESISSLHAVEHFGLGRYGDPIDPDAWRKFCSSLARVLRPGGDLYFSVPCGHEVLCFNAHRIFAPQTILAAFSSLRLIQFAAVRDDGTLDETMTPEELATQHYGCGLFHFTK